MTAAPRSLDCRQLSFNRPRTTEPHWPPKVWSIPILVPINPLTLLDDAFDEDVPRMTCMAEGVACERSARKDWWWVRGAPGGSSKPHTTLLPASSQSPNLSYPAHMAFHLGHFLAGPAPSITAL